MRKSRVLLNIGLKAEYNIKNSCGGNMFTKENLFDVMVIDCYLESNKLTKKDFCARCGINESVLKKIYSQNTTVTVQDLIKISNEI